ncbi:MAG: hypothetical protein GX149_01170 [Acholeplasmataceae bacterium]|jgi:hypothetical protein|nr:hypothetical protein [Acholeplasmataceae bacterium]
MKNRNELIKYYKSKRVYFLVMTSINTVILGVFLIFFHKPIAVVYVFGSLILLMWIFVAFQVVAITKELKRLRDYKEK